MASALPEGARERLPRPVARRLARAAVRPVPRVPAWTVVVVVTDDSAPFLEECLEPVVDAGTPAPEVLAVLRSDRRATRDIVAAATADLPGRVLELPDADAAAAGTAGLAEATNDLVLLLDAGDLVRRDALTSALAAAAHGADLAGASAHDAGLVGLEDLLVHRLVWERAGAVVPAGPQGSRHTAARLLLAAGSPETAAGPLRTEARRGTGRAFGTLPVLAPWVATWWASAQALLASLPGDADRATYLCRLLEDEVQGYLLDAERCDDEQWTVLVGAATRLLALAGARVEAALPAESRVRLRLAAAGHRRALEELVAARWLDEEQLPTEVVDGRVLARLPVDESLLPPGTLDLSEGETPLVVELRRLAWRPDGRLRLDLAAFVRRVPTGEDAVARAWLVAADGSRTPLDVVRRTDPEVDEVAAERHTDHAGGALEATVDADPLLTAAAPGDRWRVETELALGPVVRRAGLTRVEARGSVAGLPPHAGSGLTLRAVAAAGGGWELEARTPTRPGTPTAGSTRSSSSPGTRWSAGPGPGTAPRTGRPPSRCAVRG